jgi:hypothetical protein
VQGPSPDEVALVEGGCALGFEFVGRTRNALTVRLAGHEVCGPCARFGMHPLSAACNMMLLWIQHALHSFTAPIADSGLCSGAGLQRILRMRCQNRRRTPAAGRDGLQQRSVHVMLTARVHALPEQAVQQVLNVMDFRGVNVC